MQQIPDVTPGIHQNRLRSSMPFVTVILLLIFVPPVGWYFFWKKKEYHKHLPSLLWISSALLVLSSGVWLGWYFPGIGVSHLDTGDKLIKGAIVVALYGVFLKQKFRRRTLPSVFFFPALVLLALSSPRDTIIS